MLKRLNGWQRLWVVLTVLYAVPVAVSTVATFPKASSYAHTRLHESIEAVGRYMESATPGYAFEGSYMVHQKYYGDLTDDQIIDRVHTKFKDKVDFSRIDLDYQRSIDGLPTEQVKVLSMLCFGGSSHQRCFIGLDSL